MWLPILGLILGIILGSVISIEIPLVYAKYMSVAILASLDSVLGGIKSLFNNSFDSAILLTGFISNALIAALLAYIGDRLGIDLYLAAVFAFGVRIFQNLAEIRHQLLFKKLKNRKKKES